MQKLEANAASSAVHAGIGCQETETAYVRARCHWPGVHLSYEKFCAHLALVGSTARELAEHAADLYLCAACVNGQATALQALEAAHFPALRGVLSRLLGECCATEELLQEVRTRLFVGASPKIASYRGRGYLQGWLRRVAVHAARDHLRTAVTRRAWYQELARVQRATNVPAPDSVAEDDLFHGERAQSCVRAWNSAIHSLDFADRRLLHHHFVLGLSIDVLAEVYAVHRATVARRIQRVTRRVRTQVRQTLVAHELDSSPRDLDAQVLRACCELGVTFPFDSPYAA